MGAQRYFNPPEPLLESADAPSSCQIPKVKVSLCQCSGSSLFRVEIRNKLEYINIHQWQEVKHANYNFNEN